MTQSKTVSALERAIGDYKSDVRKAEEAYAADKSRENMDALLAAYTEQAKRRAGHDDDLTDVFGLPLGSRKSIEAGHAFDEARA